jgi:hypothetical protein
MNRIIDNLNNKISLEIDNLFVMSAYKDLEIRLLEQYSEEAVKPVLPYLREGIFNLKREGIVNLEKETNTKIQKRKMKAIIKEAERKVKSNSMARR